MQVRNYVIYVCKLTNYAYACTHVPGGPKKNGATLHFPKYLENY